MGNSESVPIVRCAEEYIRLFYTDTGKTSLKAFLILAPVMGLIEWSGHRWLGGVLLMGAIIFFILPRLRSEQLFLNSLSCAHCGEPAGRYFSKQAIIHLRCRHCGKVSRTDCMRLGPGAPSKI